MTIQAISKDHVTRINVLDELSWDSRLEGSDLRAQVHDGVVTLEGTVGSYAGRIAAREAAHRVVGVLDVVDSIEVRVPKPGRPTDQELAKAARASLRWDVFVPDEHITTSVADGIVTLDGEVQNLVQRRDAERAVQRLAGVRGVVNHVRVAGSRPDAQQVKRQIEHALERHAARAGKRIQVSVTDGLVTLKGEVGSWSEKNVIERVASYAQGVRGIDDRVTIDSCR